MNRGTWLLLGTCAGMFFAIVLNVAGEWLR